MNLKGNPFLLRRRAHKLFFLDKRDYKALMSSLTARKLEESIEEEARRQFKCRYALVTPSGKAAIEIALRALEVKKTDEVLTQAYVCAEVPELLDKYACVRYVDVDESGNLLLSALKKKITKRTRIIMPVNLYGMPAKMQEIRLVCKARSIVLLEDCAHALHASAKGEPLGTYGEAGIFSFSKALSAPAGGLFITNNTLIYKKAKNALSALLLPHESMLESILAHLTVFLFSYLPRMQRLFPAGFILDKMRIALKESEESYRYTLQKHELAICLSQMQKSRKIVNHYISQYRRFYALMRGIKGIKVVSCNPGSSALRFPIIFKRQIDITKALASLYASGSFEPSLNYYREYVKAKKLAPVSLPASEELSKRMLVVSLDNLSEKDIHALKKQIIEVINSA
ncbi:DegT/DnrJ/EryC1/StrS family aminotransferase [Candidatus Pacearchaeota archaeon]|nr:DegT/DnrJ/EryC1/StrS family aminotransferase [Candidatus Pacearchaeota archaeon]